MASNLNEILGRNIDSVKSLKTAIKELQDSLVGLDTESQEYKDTAAKLATAQDALKDTTRAGIEANLAAKDSIVGMQKEYNKLYDAYKKLSDEQRNSDFGKNMAESLEKLSTTINDSKKEVGNFTSNIGRYAQGATEAFSQMGVSLGALQTPMKMAAGGAKTLGASLKALIANPVGAVIMAIVVAMKALHAIAERVKKAINDNEESSNRLKVAMATFKPVVDAVSNAFDFLAKIVVKVIEGLAKVAEKIMSVIPGMKQAIQSHKDLAKATNELTKATREANVENSKKQAEIERLREEASATEDVTEKKRLLEEAKAMQAEVDQKNIELAQEELRIMQEYSEKTANSAEENEKLAAAQKKVNDAIAQGEKNQRMYNKQLSAVKTTTTSAGKAVDEYKKKAHELYEQLIEDNKDELTKLTEKYEKEKKLLEKYHLDTKLLTKKYEKEIAEIRLNEWKKEREEMGRAYDNWTDNLARYYKNWKATAKDNTDEILIDAVVLQDAKKKLEEFKNDAEQLLGETGDDMHDMFKIIFDTADLSNITDYNYIEEILNHFYTDEGEANRILDLFHTFGEESWASFVEGVEGDVKELNNAFGLDIKNLPDAEAKAVQLGKEIAQKFGEGAISNIEEATKAFNIDIYEQIFGVLSKDDSAAAVEATKEFVSSMEYAILEGEKSALETELSVFSGTTDQKLELMQRYYETVAELRERDQALADLNDQRTMEMVNNLIDMTDNLGNALGTIKSSYEQVVDSELKAGKIDEQQARKKKERLQKLEQVQTAFSIATIAADAAAGIFNVWKGYAMETGTINPQTAAAAGPGAAVALGALNTKSLVSAIAKTASLAATAAAQIAAARNGQIASNNNFAAEGGGGGGSVSVGATPALIDTTPYTYSRTVQTTEEEDRLNAPIFVTVTDIEEGLGHRATVTNESSF